MSLEYEDFASQAQELVRISDLLDDGWQVREVPDGNKYLYKKKYLSSAYECADQCTMMEFEFNDAQLSDDFGDIRGTFLWEYNVAYSVSYEVPALYFNVSQFGCTAPLKLDEVWSFCRIYGAELGLDRVDLWSRITQQEHPVTGVPHFVLHPCNTQNMMQQLSQPTPFKKENYLLIWLSSVGPAVGIRMPLEYLRVA